MTGIHARVVGKRKQGGKALSELLKTSAGQVGAAEARSEQRVARQKNAVFMVQAYGTGAVSRRVQNGPFGGDA